MLSDFSIDRDTIAAELISQLSEAPNGPRSFRSQRALRYVCSVVNTRYQYLLGMKEKLGSSEAVIEYLEALKIRSSQQAIHFPTNSIHPLTIVSPLVQTQFNGLVQLPTRVDLLTGAKEIHPDYTGEPVLESELMTVEDIPMATKPTQGLQVQFDLKRMRIKE